MQMSTRIKCPANNDPRTKHKKQNDQKENKRIFLFSRAIVMAVVSGVAPKGVVQRGSRC